VIGNALWCVGAGMQALMDGVAHGRFLFFAKAGDVVIPLAAVALVLLVHAQQ
jgi:hypothetical protein